MVRDATTCQPFTESFDIETPSNEREPSRPVIHLKEKVSISKLLEIPRKHTRRTTIQSDLTKRQAASLKFRYRNFRHPLMSKSHENNYQKKFRYRNSTPLKPKQPKNPLEKHTSALRSALNFREVSISKPARPEPAVERATQSRDGSTRFCATSFDIETQALRRSKPLSTHQKSRKKPKEEKFRYRNLASHKKRRPRPPVKFRYRNSVL